MPKRRRTRQLKVYAGTINGCMERVVAAPSATAAMRSLRVGRLTFLSRFRVTKLEDYEAVKQNPGTVYERPLWCVEGDPFTRVTPSEEDGP